MASLQFSMKETLMFFAKNSVTVYQFENQQRVDLGGLMSRLRSTSYALTPTQKNYSKGTDRLFFLIRTIILR